MSIAVGERGFLLFAENMNKIHLFPTPIACTLAPLVRGVDVASNIKMAANAIF